MRETTEQAALRRQVEGLAEWWGCSYDQAAHVVAIYLMETHGLIVRQDFVDGTFVAECSCGWSSDERNAEAAALADWRRHLPGDDSTPEHP